MTRVAAPFVIVVPPGWARLPAREEDRDALRAVVDRVIADAMPDTLPRDRAEPIRQEMRKRLTSMVADAGDSGATAAYLPVQSVDGFTPPVSLIESEVDDESEGAAADVVAQLLHEAGQLEDGVVEVDGALAARTETTYRRVRTLEDLPDVDDRQVVYTISVPHRPGTWVIMSFSAISEPDADPRLTDALVMLFDAMMSTFRWIDVPDAEPTDLERRIAEITEEVAR